MSARVAVVVPTRNRSALLGEALGSVLGQTRPPDEVYVVDDASEGEHRVALDRLVADGDVRVVRLAERRGGAVARNVGWRGARSDLVAFLDDDDVWHPEKLERQLGALEEAQADFSWTGLTVVRRADGADLGRLSVPEVDYASLLVSSDLYCSTLLVARDVLERIGGFDESLPRNQDWDLFLRLFRDYRGLFTEGELTTIRRGRPDARACLDGRAIFFEKWQAEIQALPEAARRRAHFTHHWLRWGNRAQLGDVRGEWSELARMAPFDWSDARLWRSLAVTALHSLGWRGAYAGRDPS